MESFEWQITIAIALDGQTFAITFYDKVDAS
jgi:hypothetical protein